MEVGAHLEHGANCTVYDQHNGGQIPRKASSRIFNPYLSTAGKQQNAQPLPRYAEYSGLFCIPGYVQLTGHADEWPGACTESHEVFLALPCTFVVSHFHYVYTTQKYLCFSVPCHTSLHVHTIRMHVHSLPQLTNMSARRRIHTITHMYTRANMCVNAHARACARTRAAAHTNA